MTSVIALLTELKKRDIKVSLNGDKLKVSAPTGALTDDIKQQLQISKEDLIEFLKRAQAQTDLRPQIERADRNQPLPLTYSQQRLWILDKMQPGLAAYNMPMAVRVRGAVDIAAMQRTVNAIVERHEILRASLYEINGTPFQRINAAEGNVLQFIDGGDIEPSQRNAVAEQLASSDAQTPFDLSGALFRASLTRLGDNDFVLLANMHHLVSDGWSTDVLLREIGALYAHHAMGLPLQLQPLPIQYVDFAAWQRQWLDSDAHHRQLDYWKNQFKGAPSLLKLPTDRPRPTRQTFAGDTYQFRFGKKLSEEVKAFCQQQNVTLFSVLLAAYQLVLSRHAQQDDICVAIPSAGRNRRELEGLIGFFVNVLIMRTKITGNASVLDFVRAVKATALSGFANEDMPMEKIIEAVGIDWNPAYPPLAQVGFALQNIGSANLGGASPQTATQLGSISIEGIGAERKSAKYDMILFVTEGDDFGGSIEYNTDLFDAHTIERLSRHVKHVLTQMVQQPKAHLAAIAVASEDELRELLELPADRIKAVLPLTPNQRDLYLAHLIDADTLVNNVGQSVEIHADIDASALRKSLQQLIDNHSLLRATLVASPATYTDNVYWAVQQTRDIDLRLEDWISDNLTAGEINARVRERMYQPFDIHDALYHAELIRLAPQYNLLLLIGNHIVFDGVALRVFNEQLTGLLQNQADVLSADNFAGFVAQSLNTYDTPDAVNFWREQLAQCEPLTLPAAQLGATQTLKSDRIRIDNTQLVILQAWCSVNDATLPQLFKALYGVLINSYARADADFQVRDTLSGRSGEFRATLGCLHQNAPFVFRQTLLQPATALSELLQDVRNFPRQIIRKRALISLGQLQRIVDTGRCGFMYNFYSFEEPLDFHGTAAPVVTYAPLEIEGQVQLIAKPMGDVLEIDLHYYDHLFPNLRFLERLVHLAQQVAQGARTVGELSLVLPDEQNMLAQWNPPGQIFEQFAVHTRFEHMAERFADRIAITCDGAQWTYRELNERANQIAHALMVQGVQIGDFVGLSMERSLELMAGILGILKANAAYVPLDPHFPPERLAFILEDSQARILLTHAAAGEGLASFDGITIAFERDAALIDAQPKANPFCYATPASTIYVLYTSGTTGRPKGCVVSHGNVARLMTATDGDFRFDETDVWTLFHSYAFDFTVWEMWGALLYGGKLVVVPYLLARSPHEFYELLLAQNVTVLNQTPSAFSQLIAVDDARGDAPGKNKSTLALRYVVFGGEALDFNALRTWVGRHGLQQPKLINMYGITETTVHVTRYTLTEKDFAHPGSIVGRPIVDLHVHIVDRHGKPTPIGLPGEMRIAGPGVTNGYLKRDDLTAERFTPNAFAELLPIEQRNAYATLYHSGDLARFTARGDIEYLGRIDLQVKIRGHRIELGEIMAQLAALDEVREAVVIVREDEPGDQRLAAYLLLPEGRTELDLNSVRAQLKVTLPEYMVPSNFIVLDAWPLTPTGKVDKKALPVPEGETARSTHYVAPRNETEARLCALWADMLGVPQIGIDDNFFELGGHSLLATRIVGRVREEFQCDINLRALFEQPTVAALAAQIDGTDSSDVASAIARPPLTVTSREGRIPVSHAQQRLWIIDQLQPGSPVYNMPTVLRLSGDLDIAALEKTIATLVERHESLRTTFSVANGEPHQVIQAFTGFALPQFAINDDELQLQSRAAAFAMASFDLKHGPLFKAELWKLTNYRDADDKRYVLAVNMHHIISDGMSVEVLLREVIALYTAFTRGMGNPLLALPFQYADFAVWQRSWLQGEALQTQIDYWKQQLLGVPKLELPTDFARTSIQNPAGKQFSFHFDEALSQQLRELAQRNGVTLYQTLLAAFQLLLARYSRQDDIAVGSPIANRTLPALEPIIGFFVNTLVMRSQIDADETFEQLLAQVRRNTLDAYAHQDVSFEKLVDALNVPRELSHTPLFQVMFVLQSAAAPSRGEGVNGLAIAPLFDREEESDCAAKFDITLALTDTGSAFSGTIEYRTALFKPQTMRALIAHFEALLSDIIGKPQAKLRDYNILTSDEIEQQLIGFNAAVSANVPTPSLLPIHKRFEQMAARFGERTAITSNTQAITYNELNTRANQIAYALHVHGVQPGDYVGLCLERSIELIAAMLGILKAGAAYVPLDAHFPAERLQYILEDSQARALITESALIDVLPGFTGSRIVVDTDIHALTNLPGDNPNIPVPLSSTIYIIYTSGTTGKPKGCLLNHGNVARLFTATDDEFRFNEHDVWTLFHSFAFDFSVWEIWGALLFGARLVIVPHAISRAPDEFYNLLISESVTVLNQTPSAFSQLVAIDAMAAQPASHKLRCVVFGGEALDFNALRPWVKRYGLDAPQLINMYGITETTVHVTYYPLTQKDFDQGGSIVGRPIRDLHVHLLDAHGQLAPVGIAGEIHVSGPGVSDGYLKRPDLTGERFIDNPLAHYLPAPQRAAHNRLYKSGDLARYLANGDIEYLGRIDLQVKIRGHRIELGEIMAQLATLDDVREAVVVVREDVPGDMRLIGYLLKPADRDDIDLNSVRTQLKVTLPDYMIPSTFVVMDAWPLTPNGKIDKKALPAPDQSATQFNEYIAPRNDIEAQIAAIWQNLLGIEAVSINANFFELGGHSLLATQVMSRLREQFDIELPLRTLFEQPTIEQLAIAIATSTAQSLLPPISVADRSQPLPLSFNQQRLWFVQQMEPTSSAYNMPVVLRIRGTLDGDALERAFQQLIARHAVLRTRFTSIDDEPRQIIDNGLDWQLARKTVNAEVDTARTNAVTALAAQQAAMPFNLATGPVLRATLYQLDGNDHVLVAVMHHIASDGWSMQLIVKELATLYANETLGAGLPLPALPIQYADFAAWQREHLQGDNLTTQLNWWKQQLQDAPRLLNLPTDRPRPPVQTDHGAALAIKLSPQLSQQVQSFARQHQLTPFMVMLAAYQLLLAKYAGQNDICVGTPIAGRHQRETENLIGFFVNALLARTRLDDNPRVRTLLARVKENVLGAFAHQDVPTETIIENLNVPRSLAYSPIAQVGFNYLPAAQANAQQSIDIGDLAFEAINSGFVAAKYDMIWSFSDDGSSIGGGVEYRTDLFDESTVAQMATHYQQLLAALMNDTECGVATLQWLPQPALFAALELDASQFERVEIATAMQRDLHYDTVLNPHNRHDYLGVHLEIPFAVDAALWQQAVELLHANNSALRTRLITAQKPWLANTYAAIARPGCLASGFEFHDLRSPAISEDDINARIDADVFTPYTADDGSLYRCHLYQLGDDRFIATITAHHAILDGVGLINGLILQILATYEALVRGKTPPLAPDLYGDYYALNHSNVDTEEAIAFWTESMQGVEPLTAYVEPARAGRNGTYHARVLKVEREHWEAIGRFCKQHRTTPALYLKSLYALLLASTCNAREDFYFQEITLGRPKSHAGTIGLYFEQTPFIVRKQVISADSSVFDLLAHTGAARKQMRDGLQLSNRMQHLLLPQARSQVFFNFYPMPMEFDLLDRKIASVQHIPEMVNSINVVGRVCGNELELLLTYTDNVFTDAQFLERIVHLSKQMIGGVTRLGDLTLTFASEQPNLLEQTHRPRYSVESVQALFENQVVATPDAIAIEHGNSATGSNNITFAALNRRANQLAHFLRQRHEVGRGDIVGCCFAPGIELMVAILGAIKAGAAYVPMDANYPTERLAYMLRDSNARVLLSENCLSQRLPESDCTCIMLDDDGDAIAAMPQTNPVSETALDDLLYVIYTSGSTGRPKGAGVKHRGELNLLAWYVKEFRFSRHDNFLIISAIGFDLTQKNLFAPLVSGGRIVMPEGGYDDTVIRNLIEARQISVVNCAPSAFYPLVEHASDVAMLNSLRLILFGGEPIRVEKLLPWLSNANCVAQVINMYGPTECTDISSFYRVVEPQKFVSQPIPIGKANDNVQLYIVDASNRLLPAGVPGELLVGGEGVGVGYLGKPDLTHKVFIDNPFGEGTLYRTGDLVRELAGGNIEFIGRIDFQIKLRGLRIELGEIEFALRQLAGVTDAQVLVRDERLIAYVTATPDVLDNLTISPWRAALASYLPDYMIPQALVALPKWPLTPNGKIDRNALPSPDASTATYVAPRNDAERKLAILFAEVLGLERVSIHDDFFALGGHSLLATRVVARIRDGFKVELPLRELFNTTSVAGLAQLISRATLSAAQPPLAVVDRNALPGGRVPLSFAQQRLWLIDQIQNAGNMYNIPLALRIRGDLDTDALIRAFAELVERHETLRTTIDMQGEEAFQHIHDARHWQLDVRHNSDDIDALRTQATIWLFARIDLQQGPLFRARLITRDEQDHVLLIVMHHIISDGWSVDVLVRELITLYIAFSQGLPSPLPALAIQYADFTVWQRNYLQGDVLDTQINYWRSQLTGVPLLELPTDKSRPALLSAEGGLVSFSVDNALAAQLQTLARSHNATLFMVLMAAFQTLLARYSGQDDIAVGTPIANRTQQALEPIIGFFVNTLVIRGRPEREVQFSDFLDAIRQTTLDAYAHQDVSFEKLIDALNIPRDLSQTPLFQVMFMLQNIGNAAAADGAGIAAGNLRVESLNEAGTDTVTAAKFDITLTMTETATGIDGAFEYRRTLFERDTLQRMTQHFVQLLQTLVTTPDAAIGRLPLLTLQERSQLVTTWNQTVRDYPRDALVHQLIERRVENAPQRIAARFGNDSWTFAQLNAQANRIARQLIAMNIDADTLVGVCLERSLPMVAALLGVLKAGCAYVPIDPQYPQERTEYVIDSAQLKVLVTQQSLLERLPSNVQYLCVDRDAALIATNADDNLPSRNTAARPMAYTIYTSGSTGKPKGVAIPQQAFVNFLYAMDQGIGIDEDDVLLAVTTLSFDIAGLEIFLPLLKGAQIVIASRDDAMDDQALTQLIEQRGVTFLQATPATWHLLVNSGWRTPRPLKGLCGGEPLPPKLANELLARGVDVYNVYGPTETTVWSSLHHLTESVSGGSVPIGRPIANTSLFVLDDALNPVPVGVAGELYIGGDGVAFGYLGRDDLTVERFIDNPFQSEDPTHSQKIYRTGDLARYWADGKLECLGRIDNQVKVRGFRIELGEIETVLNRHAGVKEGVVHALKGDDGNALLAAYVVTHGDEHDVNAIKTHLRASLPEYMVPGSVLFLDAMPLTPNGKVDRKALPVPQQLIAHDAEYVAPDTETEQQLTRIWSELLGVTHVSVEADFFNLGGHSLLATQLVSRIRNQFGADIKLRDLFSAHTLREQAQLIEQRRGEGAIALERIVPADRNKPLPLSFSQEQLWLLDRLQPGLAAYNMPLAVRLKGKLDVDAMDVALQHLLARHEVLRSSFVANDNGQPHTVIAPIPERIIVVDDHPAIPESDRAALANTLARREISTGFDLARDPLLRVKLARFADNDHLLVATVHHMVSDGWSLDILVRELAQFYLAALADVDAGLPPLPVQYVDYAIWQRQWLETAGKNQLQYWVDQLQGAPALLKLPTDRPRPRQQTFNGAMYNFTLTQADVRTIRALGDKHNATLFMTLMAAYQLLLARYSRQHDVVVGIPSAGRHLVETEGLIGFFVNPLVIRTQLGDNCSIDQLIEHVRETSLSAFSHANVPAEMIIEALHIARNPSYPPLAQVGFALQNLPTSRMNFSERLGDLEVSILGNENHVAKYDMILFAQEAGDHIECAFEYNTDLFDRSTIATMAEHWQRLLQAMTANSKQTIDSISPYDESELRAALGLPALHYSRISRLGTMQRDLLLASMANPDTRQNSVGYGVTLPFAIDRQRWQLALQMLHQRNPILRSIVAGCDAAMADIAYLAVARASEVALHVERIDAVRTDTPQINERIRNFVQQPYAVFNAPLVRYALYELTDGSFAAAVGAHHLIMDGFSGAEHFSQLLTTYEQLSNGNAVDTSEDPLFFDFVGENLTKFDRADAIDFWRNELRNVVPLPPPLAATRTERITVQQDLDAAHFALAKRFCRQNGLTPNLYFKAVWGMLIEQMLRPDGDFVIHEFGAGRPKGHDTTLGCYYTVQLSVYPCTALRGTDTIDALFTHLRDLQKRSRDRHTLSILQQHRLQQQSGINFSYNYLAMQHSANMLGRNVEATRCTPNADGMVDLRIYPHDDTLSLTIEHQFGLIDSAGWLPRLVELSSRILAGASNWPALHALTTAEVHWLLDHNDGALNATQHEIPHVPAVHRLIEQQVTRTPDAIAVVRGNTSLSYRELNARANQLAHYLRTKGVKANVAVGICLGRRADVLVAILAVIKAGGMYVPIDANYPEQRIAHMLSDSAAPMLISEGCVVQRIGAVIPQATAIVDIDTVDLAAMRTDNPLNIATPASGLYIIYTSGSTGLPKGARVLHRGEINLLQWYTREFAMTAADRHLIISAFGFDLTQKNLLAPLTVGACVVLPDSDNFDVDNIIDTIHTQQINMINCAPSAFMPLIENSADQRRALQALNQLRIVFFGGEPIPARRLEPWIGNDGYRCEIVNMYGPTECTDIATFHRVGNATALLAQEDPQVPLGRPNDNVELYVLNERLQPVPPHCRGELCIGGMGVGAGYLNQPELNAQKFVANPFGEGLLYRTGDLVHFDDSQQLIYDGRIDFQVKLRGLRIELGEIEAALRRLPAVSDALVVVKDDRLLGFVIGRGLQLEQSDWRTALRAHLPEYMVPQALTAVAAWPLTPNGKVDRAVLLTQAQTAGSTEGFVAPRNDIETRLAALWAELFDREQVGIHDNFFELGGHSLLAVRLITRIEQTFGSRIPLAALFSAQTIAQIADILLTSNKGWSPLVPIRVTGNKPPLFLVHAFGGMVMSYEKLAQALPSDQPVYGLQAFGFEPGQDAHNDLAAMASFYYEAIVKKQPRGPYFLAGHSFGGIIAHEIARQLEQHGETVALLAMLDSFVPQPKTARRIDRDVQLLQLFVQNNFFDLDAQVPWRQLQLLQGDKLLDAVVSALDGAVTRDFLSAVLRVSRGFVAMQVDYVPQTVSADITLLRPRGLATSPLAKLANFVGLGDPMGIDKLTRNKVSLTEVEGDHHRMLAPPALQSTAIALAQALRRAQQSEKA